MKEYPKIIRENSVVSQSTAEEKLFEIRPNDIELRDGKYVGHFGKFEIEESAGNLISFFQVQRRWVSFKLKDLRLFLGLKKGGKNKLLYGLYGKYYDDIGIYTAPLYVVRVGKEYFITDLFINQCMKKPAE